VAESAVWDTDPPVDPAPLEVVVEPETDPLVCSTVSFTDPAASWRGPVVSSRVSVPSWSTCSVVCSIGSIGSSSGGS
jgi:hypothetical protein